MSNNEQNDCCPEPEESDEICYWCKASNPPSEQRKAKKGYKYCSDCANQLFAPP